MNSATSSEILFETFIHQRSSSANVLPSSSSSSSSQHQHNLTTSNANSTSTESESRRPIVPPSSSSALPPPPQPQPSPSHVQPHINELQSVDPITSSQNNNQLRHNNDIVINRDSILASPPHNTRAYKNDVSRNSPPHEIFEQTSVGHFEAQISRVARGVFHSSNAGHLHDNQRDSPPVPIQFPGRKTEDERLTAYRDDLGTHQNHRLLSFEDLHQINLQNLTNSKIFRNSNFDQKSFRWEEFYKLFYFLLKKEEFIPQKCNPTIQPF